MAKQPATPAIARVLFMAVFWIAVASVYTWLRFRVKSGRWAGASCHRSSGWAEPWLQQQRWDLPARLPQAQTTLGKRLAAARPRALAVSPCAPCLGGKRQWGGLHRGQWGASLLPDPCCRCWRLGQEGAPYSPLLGFALGHGAMLGTAVHPPGETKPEDVSQEGAQCVAASRHGGRLETGGVRVGENIPKLRVLWTWGPQRCFALQTSSHCPAPLANTDPKRKLSIGPCTLHGWWQLPYLETMW